MGRYIVLALALAVLWLLLSGFFDKPLLLILGVLSVALTVYLSARAGVIDDEGTPVSLLPGILGYWAWLLFEIGKSNVIVAREALAIHPRLSPTWIRAPMPPRTAAGKVTFANSITMTPGTVSVRIKEDVILVHALTEALADEQGIAAMGARVARAERRL